jgi:hypothetical protein
MIIASFFVLSALNHDLNASNRAKIAIYSVLSLLIIVVIPAQIVRTLEKYKFELELDQNKTIIGSLYKGVRTTNVFTVYCVFSYLLMRFSFVLLTFTLEKMPGILVNLFMLLNNFNIIYVGWHKPYDSFAQNTIELFNLSMLHVLSYHLLLLANLMETPEHELMLGWSIIACIAIFFIVNMGYMLSLSLKKIFRQLAIRLLKIRRDRLVKKIEERMNF